MTVLSAVAATALITTAITFLRHSPEWTDELKETMDKLGFARRKSLSEFLRAKSTAAAPS